MTARRYFSHMRRGLRAGLQEGLTADAALTLSGTDGSQAITPTLQIAGPETMRGLSPSAIRAQLPPERSTDLRAGSLPYIEFNDPALPWLLSFEAPQTDGIAPFLGLIAVPEANVQLDLARQPVPAARIAGIAAELPPVSAFRLCAHVEDGGTGNGPPGADAFSRLICPQRLAPDTTYVAMVVPLYASAARAGLGLAPPQQATEPAWSPGATSAELPVYAHWTFTAGPGRGAEDILRDLFAVPPKGDPSPIAVDAPRTAPHITPPPAEVIKRAVLSVAPQPAGRVASISAALDKETALGQRRLALPAYGEAFSSVPVSARNAPAWFKDINLDPSLRTMAGHGVALMQRHQEDIIGFVRDEAGDFEGANAILARAHGALAITKRRYGTLRGLSFEALCRLAGPAAGRIRVGSGRTQQSLADRIAGTVEGMLANSAVRRAMSTGGRSLPAGRPQPGDPSMGEALADATRRVGTETGLPGSDILGRAFERIQRQSAAPAQVQAGTDIDTMLGNLADNFEPGPQAEDEDSKLARETLDRDRRRPDTQATPRHADRRLRDAILRALDPENAVTPRVAARITGVDLPKPLPQRLTIEPVWPQDILTDLLDHAPELISPSLAQLPPDGIMALSFDTASIAALVAGANHELLREIRWRGLPISGTPSPIRRVFPAPTVGSDRLPPDVPAMVDWRGGARDAFGANPPGLVILIRSALFRRFPETLVTLYRAKWAGTQRQVDTRNMIAPLAVGNVGPDAMYFAFSVSADEMRGDADPSARKPGGFLVFEQPDGGLTFGLNNASAEGASWNALAWGDLSADHISGTAFAGTRDGLTWGANSASMACILQERPVSVAIHVSDMIEGGV
ncbi:MAG: hypothetical protein AAGH83_01960 [Pseudomonadota bacterium]